MSCITTYKKICFDPINAQTKDIDIEDIAHALSLLCRAGGHFPHFYSVAQHSICCMNEAASRGYSARIQLGCLLHDASEAYLSDITRPLKPLLKEYLRIEADLQSKIFKKWLSPELSEQELKQIFEIDDIILHYEFLNMMNERIFNQDPMLISHPNFAFTDFKEIENQFISSFITLTAKI